MRLICGILQLNGAPVARESVLAMCEAMQSPLRRSRVEVWREGPVGLGVVDFDLDDLSPMLIQGKLGEALAADIRLDDAAELRREFDLPSSCTDAEIAAAVLSRQGESGARTLLGEFALAQWLSQERRLLLVRDALGVRPLCYHHRPGELFVFASFPVGIFASGLVDREPDDLSLAREALYLPTHDSSLFEGVRDLRPGHTLSVTVRGMEMRAYWKPEPQAQRHRRPEEAVEELRSLLQTAVECRLGNAGAVATHLSGGLDSSAITVMASRRLAAENRALYAYSFLADPWPGIATEDETPFVMAVLQQEPSIHWKPVETALAANWLRDRYHPDKPLSLESDAPENLVYADASAHGASLLLSGWGGDEGITFNGRGALAAAFRHYRWRYLAAEMMALRRERGFPLHNTFVGDVLQPLLSREVMNRLRRWTGRGSPEPELYGAEYVQPRLRGHLLAAQGRIAIGPDPTQNQVTLLSSPHLHQRTSGYATMAARYGMAVSFPFLDRRVVEFALSIPPHWHIQNGWKRALVRGALHGVLPPAIERRHGKLAPIPRVLFEYAKENERVRQRVKELATHPVVNRIFDTDVMAAVAASIPSIEAAGGPAAMGMVLGFSQVLTCAMYAEQQF